MFAFPGNPLQLIGHPNVGNGECAAIAQVKVPGLIPGPGPKPYPRCADWVRGARVKDRPALPMGTVIAIFDTNSRYVGTGVHSHKGGIAHTALYVRQSSEGIEVVHQYRGSHTIKGSLIRFGGGWLGDACNEQRADGYHKSGVSGLNTARRGITPEDDADKYYVVELRSHVDPNQFEVIRSAPTAH
jgi:hypothetical protein